MKFEILAKRGKARRGILEVSGRQARTPFFMPVGTAGTVKALAPRQLRELGVEALIVNTYHLHIRPGEEIVKKLGGIHRFMGWDGLVASDSGGYQVFSLRGLIEVKPWGVRFRNHIDGSLVELTPERVLDIQEALGTDLRMVLDRPLGWPYGRDEAERAVELTLRWAERSIRHFRASGHRGALFGIVQGGVYADLAVRCAQELIKMGFDGYAVGGLALGEPPEARRETLEALSEVLPEGKPRYVMGIGYPEDLELAVSLGYDMFDCVLPTRNARNGQAFTSEGALNIRNSRFKEDPRPLDPACSCYVCRTFSRAYLRHLVLSGEILGAWALTYHNVGFFVRFVKKLAEF